MAELCEDILTAILLKLPVKSLLRFSSVSKQWQTLIQSSSFVKLHLDRPTVNHINPILILRAVVTMGLTTLKICIMTLSYDDEFLDYEDIKIVTPKTDPNTCSEGVKLLGPCNGVFCITCDAVVVFFNPATRQCMKVPSSPFIRRSKGLTDYYYFESKGFGFDRVSNDYKIVRFIGPWDCRRYVEGFSTNVEIFSLNSSNWRLKEHVSLPCRADEIKSQGLFFDRGFHWLIGCDRDLANHILVFDLDEEAFKRFDLPDNFSVQHVSLSVLDESLSVIFDDRNDKFYIWVMSKYGVYESWTKVYNISLGVGKHYPLSFSKNGDYILMTRSCWLVAFNVKTRLIKEFPEKEIPIWGYKCASRYTESLVSLKRCKRKRM